MAFTNRGLDGTMTHDRAPQIPVAPACPAEGGRQRWL